MLNVGYWVLGNSKEANGGQKESEATPAKAQSSCHSVKKKKKKKPEDLPYSFLLPCPVGS